MTDRIHIRDLIVRGIVGINPDERINPQEIVVNVTMWADTQAAAKSDDIYDAINYASISQAIRAHISEPKADEAPLLIERMAAELVTLVFDVDPRIREVELSVAKTEAVTAVRAVDVTIKRSREEILGS
ncbi:MAG: dihydroneopterin aldolase [Acidimicrobiia bacterium]|nr:dihydroneopterin aldolase [Acidimicrobiia bacterium]NNL27206.1 dihydroneopterin aldolase [Acidimicrobiia bacterium]